jgi:hypothetical protein
MPKYVIERELPGAGNLGAGLAGMYRLGGAGWQVAELEQEANLEIEKQGHTSKYAEGSAPKSL